MKKMAALILILVLVLSLAACGGNTSTGDKSTASSSGTAAASNAATSQAASAIQAETPQANEFSAAGKYYASALGMCTYSLPDGFKYNGANEIENASGKYTVSPWLDVKYTVNGRRFAFMEYSKKPVAFTSDAVKKWYKDNFLANDALSVAKNYKTEEKIVDGCSAILLAFEGDGNDGSVFYSEVWAIDAPKGFVVALGMFVDSENSKWVADIISTIKITK